jgi:hypothetical protein
MDRSTIRSEARRQVGEPSSGGRWADANYNSAIERAQEDFVLRTKCLKTYAAFSTAADTAEYDISESSLANFLDIAEVWYFDSTTVYRKLKPVGRDELTYLQSETRGTDATPTAYCYEDRVIEFDTEPEADKTIRVYYYKLPTALSADDSVSDVPVKFHNALVDFVCWKFKEADDLDIEGAAYFKMLYEEDILKATAVLSPEGECYDYIKDECTEADLYA